MSQLLAMLGAMTSPATPAFSRDTARLGVADRPVRTGAANGTADATGRDVPPEFAAMLTMLAGGPSMLRTDLVPKLPADEVALMDRLIDGQLDAASAGGLATLGAPSTGGAAEATGHAGESMDYALRTLLGAMAAAAAPDQRIPKDPTLSAEARQAFAETGPLAPVLPTDRPNELLVRQDGPPFGYQIVTFSGAQEVATDLRNLFQRLQELRPETLAVLQKALAPQGTAPGALERLFEGVAKGASLDTAAGTRQAAAGTRAVGQQLMEAVRASLTPVQPTPEPNEHTDTAISRHTLAAQARALQLAGMDTPARQGLQALLAGAGQTGRDTAALLGASAFDGVQARLAALEPAARDALAAMFGASAPSFLSAPSPVAPTPVAATMIPAAADNIGTRRAQLESPMQAVLKTVLAATPLAPVAALVDGVRNARAEGSAEGSAEVEANTAAPVAVESPLATMAALEAQVAALSPAAREALQQLLRTPAAATEETTEMVPQATPRPLPTVVPAMAASTGAERAPSAAMDARLLGAMNAETRAALDALAGALEAMDATVTATITPATAATARPVLREAPLAAPVAAPTPTTAVRDLDGVAPELQAKVQRVIDRMRQEYGHDVTVVEATRSQERQDYLFAQGRTRPGPVVTWTRDSAHTHGNAVDVVVDGSWDNPAGFARLQRIAREEGLRTLGMRDPGHLELMADGTGARTATAAPATAAPTPVASGMAQVAGVAGVAGTAGTAATAGVAQVAAPGVGTPAVMAANREALRGAPRTAAPAAPGAPQGTSPGTTPGAAQPAAAETTADLAASVASATGATTSATPTTPNATPQGGAPEGGAPAPRADLGQGGSSRDRGSDRRDDRQLADAEARAASVTAGGSATDATPRVTPQDMTHGTMAAPPVVDAAPPAPSRVSDLAPGAAQASRVAELQDQREAAPAAPLSRMTLAVEGAQGGEDRITVDLRGTAVDAHIATDAISAERLRQRSVELQDALGRHGLDAELLRVSSNAAGGDAGTGGQREPRTREEARREQQGPRDEPRTRDQQDEGRRGRRNPYQERAG